MERFALNGSGKYKIILNQRKCVICFEVLLRDITAVWLCVILSRGGGTYPRPFYWNRLNKKNDRLKAGHKVCVLCVVSKVTELPAY